MKLIIYYGRNSDDKKTVVFDEDYKFSVTNKLTDEDELNHFNYNIIEDSEENESSSKSFKSSKSSEKDNLYFEGEIVEEFKEKLDDYLLNADEDPSLENFHGLKFLYKNRNFILQIVKLDTGEVKETIKFENKDGKFVEV